MYNKRYVDRSFDAPPPGRRYASISFERLYRPCFATVVAHFADACRASRRHNEYAAAQLRVFGDHGPDISGCVRDHFPEDRKDVLRNLARAVTEASDRAHAARPKGARKATINMIGRLVATRDGSGFYGPQSLV
jgi:hypothetical protein